MARDLSFISSKPVEHTVNGEAINFYPLRLDALHLLKGLVKPISGAVSILFAKTDTDTGRQFDEFASKEEGMASSKTKIDPISVELARFRSTQKEAAISNLMELLTDQARHKELILIVTDSMRDEFPLKLKDNQVVELSMKWDIVILIELFRGVIKANGGIFDPLVSKVREALAPAPDLISQVSPLLQFPASQTLANENAVNQPKSTSVPQSNAS